MSYPKKVVLLGHFGVGKTSLVRRFVESEFSEGYIVTVGVHVKKKEVTLQNQTITLVIWDIEGATAIEKTRESYLIGTEGFIYVFDVSRPETYQSLNQEINYLDTHFKGVPKIIIGNKIDTFKDGISKSFFETEKFKDCVFTSAKTGEHVEDVFLNLTKKIARP